MITFMGSSVSANSCFIFLKRNIWIYFEKVSPLSLRIERLTKETETEKAAAVDSKLSCAD